MPKVTTCPDVSQYQRLAASQLPDGEKESLLGHLEGCDSCAQKLHTLAEGDTLVSLLRQAQTLSSAPFGATLAALVERLSKLRPSAEPSPIPTVSAVSRAFTCPTCRQSLQVKSALAGQTVQCPHCKGSLRIPTDSAGSPKPPPLPASAGATGSWEPGKQTVSYSRNPIATLAKSTVDYVGDSLSTSSVKKYHFLAPAQAPDEIGRLGPYRVLKVLGAGGMGVVFRAEDPQLQRLVALKAMLPTLAASTSARQRFVREAQSAAAIKHDNIVTIYQVGADRGVPFLAMEFLEGESLSDRLKRERKPPLAEVLRIVRQIALGLAAAHKRALIHRDIKPANIWLERVEGVVGVEGGGWRVEGKEGAASLPSTLHPSPATRVKILDFGLARAVQGENENQITQQGMIVGSPAYMAPEQAQGKVLDFRCDLFSLGCVLYRMTTGTIPFKGTDVISTLLAVTTHEPAPPLELDPGLPPGLSAFIMSLLAKEAKNRPPSAQAVADALERHAAVGSASRAAPTTSQARLGSPSPQPPTAPAPRDSQIAKSSAKTAVQPAPVSKPLIKKARQRGQPSKGSGTWKVVGVGMALLAVMIGLWAGGVIHIRTPDGVLLLDVNEEKPDVFVDGKHVTVTWDNGGKKAEIRIKPGTRKVEVKKDGFTMYGEEVEVKDGERRLFTARLDRPPPARPVKGTSEPAPSADGFVPLFNGKDLTGWKTHPKQPGNWRVEKGILIGSGASGSHLYTERADYEDFYLRAEARINDGGFTGIYFRCPFGPNPNWASGYKAQINSNRSNEQAKTGSLWADSETLVSYRESIVRPNQWFTLEIIAERDRLTVKVNGQTTANYRDPKRRFTWGHIALQEEGPLTHAEFRKIEIKKLPPAKTEATTLKVTPSPSPSTGKGDAITNSIGMKLVYIPAGKFLMGSPKDEAGRLDDEGPEHEVEITKGFYMGIYEVTQGEYEKMMGNNPSRFSAKGSYVAGDTSRFPVERVNYEEAVKFCEKLSTLESDKSQKRLYRLPNEAEWEYACRGRASSKTPFCYGKTLSTDQANFVDNKRKGPCEVGSYRPNSFGLFDMHGNVGEWCSDWHYEDYFKKSPAKDPQGPESGLDRVVRGGSYATAAEVCRSAYRHDRCRPLARVENLGFRVVMVVSGNVSGESSLPSPSLDPDRMAAQYVLSIGGVVRVNDEVDDIKILADLPHVAFRLTYVDLSRNRKLRNADLTAFKGCTNLKFLDLQETQAKDEGLANFKDCKNLTVLNLYFTQLSNAGLVHFKDCKDLTYLCLAHVQMSDAGLVNFKDCKKLTHLLICETQVGDIGLVNFKDCKNLTHLNLNDTKTSDAGLTNFKDCTGLTLLGLGGTKVKGSGLSNFKDCKNLAIMNLNNTKVSDADLVCFKDCRNLESLELNRMKLTDAGLVHFKDCKKIKNLDLRDTPITEKGLASFKGCDNLERLQQRGSKVTKAGLDAFRKEFPKCEVDLQPDWK